MSRAQTEAVTSEPIEIRITDAYVYRLVAAEQAKTGERSMSRTAARLITERIAIREVKPDAVADEPAVEHSAA